jgi:uncharacterized protein YjiS (DUF1127 family)
MTSMKSFELSNLGKGSAVPLIGHETMSFLTLAKAPFTNLSGSDRVTGLVSPLAGLIGLLDGLLTKVEVLVERNRLMAEVDNMEDWALVDIGLTRAEMRRRVTHGVITPPPSLLRRSIRAVKSALEDRRTVKTLEGLSDALLRDIGLERYMIAGYIKGDGVASPQTGLKARKTVRHQGPVMKTRQPAGKVELDIASMPKTELGKLDVAANNEAAARKVA